MDRLDGTAKGKESSHTEKKRRPCPWIWLIRYESKAIRVRNRRVGLKR